MLLLCACLLPAQGLAVGLGSIEMKSALNQRLDAEIPLRGVDPEQAGDVIVTLASEEDFREVGLPRPFMLTNLRFEVVERGGELFVQVTSSERITEPYLSFLVEVDGPSGNLLREYTVLLDPPVYASEETEPAVEPEPSAEAEAAAREPAGETGAEQAEAATVTAEQPERRDAFGDEPVFLQVERERDQEAAEARRREVQRRAAEEQARREAERAAEAAAPAMPERYRTQRGDTAWELASRFARGDTTVQQMMVALLRENPEAFVDGNVNRMRSGYVMRVPPQQAARSLEARQAIATVERQDRLWREWRDELRGTATAAAEEPEPAAGEAGDDVTAAEAAAGDGDELRIVGATESGGEVAADDDTGAPGSAVQGEELQLAREQLESVRLEKEELESRVSELESTVERMEQLITLREEQMRQLQDRLAEVAEREGIDLAEEDLGGGDAAEIEIVSLAAMVTRMAEVAASRERELAEESTQVAEADAEAGTATTEEPADSAVTDGDGDGAAGADDEAAATDGDETAADDAAAEGQATGSEEGGDDETTETAAASDTDEAGAAAAGDGGDGGGGAAGGDGIETVRTQPGEDGWLARLMAPVTALAGAVGAGVPGGPLGLAAAAAAVLALIGLIVVRRRQAAADEEIVEVEGDLGDEFGDDMTDEFGDLIDEGDTTGGAAQPADETLASEPETAAADAPAEEDPLAAIEASDTEPEKDDTVAEADVYLAYGLHQQARDLLHLALQEAPERRDYHAKLLETLYAAGDRDEFVAQAERFREILGDTSDPEWQPVATMGRELAPDHALFGEAEATGGAARKTALDQSAATDVGPDEGGDESEPDFLLDEADSSAEDESPAADTTGEQPATAGPAADEDEPLEFDLGDLEDLGAEPDTTAVEDRAESGTASDHTDATREFDLDESASAGGERTSPTDVDATVHDTGEFEFDLEKEADTSAARQGSTGGAASDTGGDDDWDFDLSELDNLEEEPEQASGPASTRASAETGDAAEFDLSEFETGDATEASAPGAAEPAGATVETGEFDLGELEQTGPAADAADESTLPDTTVGTDASGESTSAPDEEDESDELDTMIDLARAYIDMGDPESATSALEEVVSEGSERQRREAREILESVQ